MRRKRDYTRNIKEDIKYSSVALAKFINYIMLDGKKNLARKIVYEALDLASKKLNKSQIDIFNKSIENVSPNQEVISKRIGGANYQIPRNVRDKRRFFLAYKWIIESARLSKGKAMSNRLADEFICAFNNEGSAIHKKENMRRMAEANKAFAHFAR